MNAWARRRRRELEKMGLCGFVMKSHSPSCGLERVRLYQPGRPGPPARKGTGLFARAVLDHFPRLPVAEEQHLHDRAGRAEFVRRVLACRGRS